MLFTSENIKMIAHYGEGPQKYKFTGLHKVQGKTLLELDEIWTVENSQPCIQNLASST